MNLFFIALDYVWTHSGQSYEKQVKIAQRWLKSRTIKEQHLCMNKAK